MRRRRSNLPSSLDLFLDTICNAFGGIMFLAILISVSIQTRNSTGVTTTDASDNSILSEEDAQRIEVELAELQTQRGRLLELQTQILGGLDASELKQLSKRQAELEERRISTEASRAEQRRQIELLKGLELERRAVDERLVVVRKDIEAQKQEREVAAALLNQKIDMIEQDIEIPSVRPSLKSNVLLGIRFGKVYVAGLPIAGGRGGRSSIDASKEVAAAEIVAEHVSSTLLPPDSSRLASSPRQVTLNPSSGWKLTNPPDRQAFERFLHQYPPSSTFISMAVWRDSYGEFPAIKKLLLEAGYEYHLQPVDAPPSLVIDAGADAFVQ